MHNFAFPAFDLWNRLGAQSGSLCGIMQKKPKQANWMPKHDKVRMNLSKE